MTTAPAPKRLRDRLLVGIIAVMVMSVAVALLAWASRPRWLTVVSPIIPELGVALSVEYPDDWEQEDLMNKANGWEADNAKTTGRLLRGVFMRQPPQGLSRWVREHLFKQDFSESKRDRFGIIMEIDEQGIDDYLKQQEADAKQDLNNTISVRRFQHALGPALEMDFMPIRNPSPRTSRRRGMRTVCIFCQAPARHRKMLIAISPLGRGVLPDWPEWEEIVRRIRLVPGK